jgi:hypothetical protein
MEFCIADLNILDFFVAQSAVEWMFALQSCHRFNYAGLVFVK